MPNQLTITLVRHGETTGQSSIRYYGATDIPLNAEGEAQMRRVAERLGPRRFDQVFTSDLVRTKRGAELIAPAPPALAIADFNEVDFGHWEGWTIEEIAERDPENYSTWQEDRESFTYPGGDNRLDHTRRVQRGFRSILDHYASADGATLDHWLFVVHRGVVRTVLDDTVGSAAREPLSLALGCAYTITQSDQLWQLAEVFEP